MPYAGTLEVLSFLNKCSLRFDGHNFTLSHWTSVLFYEVYHHRVKCALSSLSKITKNGYGFRAVESVTLELIWAEFPEIPALQPKLRTLPSPAPGDPASLYIQILQHLLSPSTALPSSGTRLFTHFSSSLPLPFLLSLFFSSFSHFLLPFCFSQAWAFERPVLFL